MAVLSITYTLNSSRKNSDGIREKIKSYGTYCHLSGTHWLISTSSGLETVSQHLWDQLDNEDFLFVAKIDSGAHCYNLKKIHETWLNSVNY